MEDYAFNTLLELEKYKEVGSDKKFCNYCSWEESVIEKYQNITEPKFIHNLKAKLIRESRRCENLQKSILSFWMPLLALIISLALTLTSAFISLKQYQDSVQNDASNAYLENLIKADVELNILTESKVELLQERVDQLQGSMTYVFASFYILYALVILLSIWLWVMLKKASEKIAFYQDYIVVLDKIIKAKY